MTASECIKEMREATTSERARLYRDHAIELCWQAFVDAGCCKDTRDNALVYRSGCEVMIDILECPTNQFDPAGTRRCL